MKSKKCSCQPFTFMAHMLNSGPQTPTITPTVVGIGKPVCCVLHQPVQSNGTSYKLIRVSIELYVKYPPDGCKRGRNPPSSTISTTKQTYINLN